MLFMCERYTQRYWILNKNNNATDVCMYVFQEYSCKIRVCSCMVAKFQFQVFQVQMHAELMQSTNHSPLLLSFSLTSSVLFAVLCTSIFPQTHPRDPSNHSLSRSRGGRCRTTVPCRTGPQTRARTGGLPLPTQRAFIGLFQDRSI